VYCNFVIQVRYDVKTSISIKMDNLTDFNIRKTGCIPAGIPNNQVYVGCPAAFAGISDGGLLVCCDRRGEPEPRCMRALSG